MLAAVACLGGIGFIAGLMLAEASQKFYVAVDPKEAELTAALPGFNCGACGYAGCSAYARAIVSGKSDLDRCLPGGHDSREQIYRIMGKPFEERKAEIALVHCQGDRSKSRLKYRYQGLLDCRAAQAIAGGPKLCPSGCLGFGSCVRACPFAAIEITTAGIARVNREKCTGCRRCITVCPRSAIRMVPRDSAVHVLCNSHDPGRIVRSYCVIGCISCHICEKTSPENFHVIDNLGQVRYGHDEEAKLAVAACPTGCLRELSLYD